MRTLRMATMTVVLIAGSSGAVTAEDELLFGPMTPARVSGDFAYVESISEGTVEELGESMWQTEGSANAYRVTSSDPRFGGDATTTTDWIGFYPPSLVATAETEWLVEDQHGSWSGLSRSIASMADEDPINVPEQVVLTGSGAYAGLSAHLIVDYSDETFLGAIIPDEMPDLPADWLEIYQASIPADHDE